MFKRHKLKKRKWKAIFGRTQEATTQHSQQKFEKTISLAIKVWAEDGCHFSQVISNLSLSLFKQLCVLTFSLAHVVVQAKFLHAFDLRGGRGFFTLTCSETWTKDTR